MSFLLRSRNKGGGGGGGRVIPPPAHSRSREGVSMMSKQRTSSGVLSGNQVMLQRQAPLQQQSGQKYHDSIQREEQKSQGGVISMKEVLADLKVLQQQQRDSQQKLTSARHLMEQRNKQSTVLDNKLGSLKYSNGELRAQITQHRDLLSVSDRSLGSRKLLGDQATGDIRNFEKILKRGLMSARANISTFSKIDSVLIVLATNSNALGRVKTTLKSKQAELETQVETRARKEESARSAIQEQVLRFQEGANEIATIRTESIVFEKDFLAAQNMEETTRIRNKSIEAEITAESETSRAELASFDAKIQAIVDNSDKLNSDNIHMSLELEKQLQVLKDLKDRQDPKFAVAEAHAELHSCTKKTSTLDSVNTTLEKSIENIKSHLARDSKVISKVVTECQALTLSVEEQMRTEMSRSKELETFKADLESERQSLAKLERSAKELEERRSRHAREHQEVLLGCDQEQEKTRAEIDILKGLLEREASSYEILVSSWQSTKPELLARLENAQVSYKCVESSYGKLEQLSKDLESDFEKSLGQDLATLNTEMTTAKEQSDAKVSQVLRRHPILRSIVSEFLYDSTVSFEEHSKEVLAPLKEELRNMIRQKRDSKRQDEDRRKKTELKLKRNEDGRRKKREHIGAELKRHESSLRSQALESIAAPATKRTEPSARSRKGAEFFNPASNEGFSEELTPAQPKSLLSSFAGVRGLPRKKALDLTPNYDKRVHWKDDTTGIEDDQDSVDEPLGRIRRVSKQYGTSQRGLAAISRPKKADATKRSFAASNTDNHPEADELFATFKRSDDSAVSCDFKTETQKPRSHISKGEMSDMQEAKHHVGEEVGSNLDVPNDEECVRPTSTSSILNDPKRTRLNDTNTSPKVTAKKTNVSRLSGKQKHSRSFRPPNKSSTFNDAELQSSQMRNDGNQEKNRNNNRRDRRPKSAKSSTKNDEDGGTRHQRMPPNEESKSSKTSVGSHRSRGSTKSASQKTSSSRSTASAPLRASLQAKSSRNNVTNNKSSSRSLASERSGDSGRSNTTYGSKKRKNTSISSTQTSGLSSSEGAHKARRRKKTSGASRSSMSMADDSYSFAF